jgi:enamine deaminase RidA (YjgF/YER057c/UK114 family)
MPDTAHARHRGGSDIEAFAGYSRAARVGTFIAVSGTTASAEPGARPEGDTATQTRQALTAAIDAVVALGGTRETVLRTRVLLTPDADWKAASIVHRELLGDVAPANSMYRVHSLIGDGFLVEIELDAVALD